MLVIAGCGIWVYERSLQSSARDNWEINLPFTGTVTIKDFGDAERAPGLLDKKDPRRQLRVLDPGDWPEFKNNQIIDDQLFDNAKKDLAEGVKVREADAQRFNAGDFIKSNSLIVKKEAFDRVKREGAPVTSFAPKLPTAAPIMERYAFRDKNDEMERDYVKVTKASETAPFKVGEVVKQGDFTSYIDERLKQIDSLEEERQKAQADGNTLEARRKEEEATKLRQLMPEKTQPEAMEGVTEYQGLTLIPGVRFVVPLLLAALALWLAWRMVNLPGFADFLIATEAELNKVSWIPRRRLFQDTIVVLVTTLLITVFLLFADVVWSQLLTRIGVLRAPSKDTGAEVQPGAEDLPW
jgi:preprotein translocase SecE subunit